MQLMKDEIQKLSHFMVKYVAANFFWELKVRESAVAAKTIDDNALIILELLLVV
jgi:hypothetical protein